MTKYFNFLLLLLTILITTNTFSYQATTEKRQQILKLAENYKKFLNYYQSSDTYSKDKKPLYGKELAELFDLAQILDSYTPIIKNSISKVFNKRNDIDYFRKETKFEKYMAVFAGWKFYYSSVHYISISSILKKIEPNGKDAIYLNKNYSDAAITEDQNQAIKNLNDLLSNFYWLLKTPEEVDNFFNYVIIFIENGGSKTKNAVLEEFFLADQKASLFPTAEEAEYELIRDVSVARKSTLKPISMDQQIVDILQGKGISYEYFFTKEIDTNIEAVKLYNDNFNKFIADYTPGYKAVKQAHNSRTLKFMGRYGYKNDKVIEGVQGKGTYGAMGGQEFVVNYTIAFAPNPRYYLHVIPKAMKQTCITVGIEGQPLYGYKLYELFEAAIHLELYNHVIDEVFNRNFTNSKVAKINSIKNLKNALVDFNFNNRYHKGLLQILYYIEPKGITGIDHAKNYSDAAIDSDKVRAINDLNTALNTMHKVLTTKEEQDLFFNYVATFVDNGGTKNADVIIDRSKNLNIPEFQKYRPIPTTEEVMESLYSKNNNYIKPLKLTRISNDEDLKRILGKEYDDFDSRTDEFKNLYKQAAQQVEYNDLEKYDLIIPTF
jgi:hypothetical protein